jgi:hypothetical protein
MSVFAKVTPAQKPRTVDATKIATFYALLLLVLAVTQLFSFDGFLELVNGFNLPGDAVTAYLLVSLIVVSEVFALPFLLRMPLSPAFRWLSMVLGWVVPIAWLAISLWLVFVDTITPSIGLFGATLDIMPGWWAVFVSVALGIMAAWSSWGLWPGTRKK